MTDPARIMTVGHSTHPLEAFLRLLRAHDVTAIADVRTIPGSRRHPHFGREALSTTLPPDGIAYRHFPGLGGRRRPRPDSTNGGWRHEAFRGYADHMETPEFAGSLDELLAFARTGLVAVMCAEAKWWQCHRQLLADALVARGVEVRHIMTPRSAPPHELTPFARVDELRVRYPSLV